MSRSFIVAIFEDEEPLVSSASAARQENIDIFDIYTPFPVHGLDDFLQIKRTRLPIVCFLTGLLGFVVGAWFQIWSATSSWPIIVGGKPHNSIPAFVPVTFEITVLFAALLTVFFFFVKSKLYFTKEVKLFDKDQTDHKFALVIERKDASIDFDMAKTLLLANGACEVKIVDFAET